MSWKRESERHALSSKGIKTTTKHTRSYGGVLVKDYGYHELLKKLKSRYPELRFYTDIPLKAPKSGELSPHHEITVRLSPRLQLKYEDEMSFVLSGFRGEWTAYQDDEVVDLYKELDKFYSKYKEELK